MVHVSIRSVVIAAVFTLVGCAGPTGDPQKSASKSLGVEGGQVTAPNGVGVTIPSGALRRATTITLTPASADQVRPNTPSVGEMYEFGPEGQVFDVPAKVKLEVDLSRLPAGYSIADVVVQRAPVGTAAFETLPTRIVDSNHVEADTLHFSVFVPTLDSARGGSDGGVDAGIDGGACTERCVSPNDGGADCECSRVCGADTLEIQCSGSSPLGCACVRNGVQVGSITALVCPGVGDLERLCGFTTDAGVDGGTDGGIRPDGGTDGGSFDGGTDGGIRPDGGIDGGSFDGGTDGGSFDGGTDGGIRPDGGTDGGSFDGGTDGGSFDGGTDGGSFDGGTDGGIRPDGGTDGGAIDGGSFDGGSDAGSSDAGSSDAGRDAGSP